MSREVLDVTTTAPVRARRAIKRPSDPGDPLQPSAEQRVKKSLWPGDQDSRSEVTREIFTKLAPTVPPRHNKATHPLPRNHTRPRRADWGSCRELLWQARGFTRRICRR